MGVFIYGILITQIKQKPHDDYPVKKEKENYF